MIRIIREIDKTSNIICEEDHKKKKKFSIKTSSRDVKEYKNKNF